MCAWACAPVCACAYACPLRWRPLSGKAHAPMPILTARCQMGRRRSLMQEGSFLGREIALCGIQRQTWVASFQNGIALSFPPAAAAAATHAAADAPTGARTLHTFLLPFCVPPPPATIPPRHLSTRARSTGENTARASGNPGSRTVGLSARPIADSGPDGQNNAAVPGQSGGSNRRLHVDRGE